MKLRAWVSLIVLAGVPGALFGQFAFRDVSAASIELSENGAPVFVYNYGAILREGAAADRARCCYLHPVYAPNGAVLTDDFPADHPHHRGISWMWPVVTVGGQTYDLWTIKGIHARFEKWNRREAGADSAALGFTDGWYVDERKVVEEEVEIVTHAAANGRRELDFTLRFRALAEDVSIAGTPDEKKGYGGFDFRFAPRTGTAIGTAGGRDAADSDLQPQPWAELTGNFGGKAAGARITIDPSNAGSPNGWILRHYGFLGVDFPGLQPYRLEARQPLVMKFRVTLLAGAPAPAKNWVLVYTRNGKGYVHENIAASVEAIRKMGAENAFGVDATNDPNFITAATLKQYKVVVFANTNNEAFTNDAQRSAFQAYIQGGGGFVGIHSASGSERAWPWYWSMIGGSFLYHPKLQKFTVTVADRGHPSTRHLPAGFDWEDECYHLQYMNPNLHALLVTDPTALDDATRAQHPYELVGHALPLAWTLRTEGGRVFYTALGHKKEDYANPLLYRHILGGILWAMAAE